MVAKNVFAAAGWLCLLLSNLAVAGNNWLRDEGEAAYIAGVQYGATNQLFDKQGKLVPFPCAYSGQSLNQSLEYGYSYHYTLLADVPLQRYTCGQNSVAGIGDVALGVRGRIDDTTNGQAWEVKLLIPGGYNQNPPVPNPKPAGYMPMRLGYGELGVEMGAYFGESFDSYGTDPYEPQAADNQPNHFAFGSYARVWRGAPATQIGGYGRWNRALSANWGVGANLGVNWTLGQGQALTNANYGTYSRSVLLSPEIKYTVAKGTVLNLSPSTVLYGQSASRMHSLTLGINQVFSK